MGEMIWWPGLMRNQIFLQSAYWLAMNEKEGVMACRAVV
jgi:hypothetical protein